MQTIRANGRNIVGQQLPTLLDVTCFVRLHTLLHVVARSLAQQCWELLRPFARSLRADSSSCRHEKLFGIVWTEAYRR